MKWKHHKGYIDKKASICSMRYCENMHEGQISIGHTNQQGDLSDGETLQRYTQNSIILRSGKILDAKVN